MNPWTKDQHFVPQAYLRLFSHDQNNIWVYDSTRGTIQSQRIKDTGFIKWFYLSRVHPAPLDVSEVSRLEGQAKTIIQKIEAREIISPVELGHLLNFTILQFLRTPAARERAESAFNLFWQELRKRYFSAGPEGKNKAERIAEDFLKDQEIQLTARTFLESDIEVDFPAEFFPQSIPGLGQSLMQKLADQGWEFLSAENKEFITSDDPFSIASDDTNGQNVSIGKDTYKIIPLSNKICMVIGGNKRGIIIKKMLPWAVKLINLSIASVADKYVYASSEILLKEVVDDLPKFKKNPGSFAQILISSVDPSA